MSSVDTPTACDTINGNNDYASNNNAEIIIGGNSGGGRASETNDKAGSILSLYRWVSPRTIKENFLPATDYRCPFMDPE